MIEKVRKWKWVYQNYTLKIRNVKRNRDNHGRKGLWGVTHSNALTIRKFHFFISYSDFIFFLSLIYSYLYSISLHLIIIFLSKSLTFFFFMSLFYSLDIIILYVKSKDDTYSR